MTKNYNLIYISKCPTGAMFPLPPSKKTNISAVLPEIDYVVSDRCENDFSDKHRKLPGSSVFVAKREAEDQKFEREESAFSFVADATTKEYDTICQANAAAGAITSTVHREPSMMTSFVI